MLTFHKNNISEHASAILKQKRDVLIQSFLNEEAPSFTDDLTLLFDDYFSCSYEKSLVGPQMGVFKNPYALVALGGYGRKEQCIHSDVDLLFLFKNSIPKKAEELVKEIVYPLWDAGFEVGHATRTIKECIQMAGGDIEVLMSLIDGRFICGASNLFMDMLEKLRKKVIRSRHRKIISMLFEESQERHLQHGDSSYLLEPNLKEGQGGLRDYHAMLWAARIKYGLKLPGDLVDAGVFSEKEFQTTEGAVLFIRKVRNLLHYETNRKCDQLYLEHQAQLADLMKFSKKDGQEPVERFLGMLHGKMDYLKQQHQIFFSELGHIKPMKQGRRILGKRTRVKGLVVDKKNMLTFTSKKAVRSCPELLILIFRESTKLAIPLSATAKRMVKDSLYLVDDKFMADPVVIKTFEDILTAPPATGTVLDEMLTTGFLTAFIPEMKGIVNRIQYNEYHIYPVDKHSIKTVQMVKNFSSADESDKFYYDVYNDLAHKELLLWACLLHDIGKSESSGDHSESGALIAETILKNKGYSESDIKAVRFLIKEHLFLIQIATRRDILEEGTAIYCARKIKYIERLNMLYLLTVADSMSTGPKAWNDWSSALLRELYIKIRNILKKVELTGSESVELAEKKKHDIRAHLSGRKEQTDIDLTLDILSPRYLFYVPTTDILNHIDLFDRLKDSEFVWDVQKDATSNTRIISVCAKNKPGLFSKIAGVLTLSNLDILNAQIYTWKNNIALDIFHVSPPKDQIFEDDTWKRVGKKLTETLCYDVNLSIRLKQKILESKPGRLHTLKMPHKVTIDNESSDFFTIIEVCTYDYPGLLFSITDTLYRIGLDIYIAKIATKVDQVMDIFYVRNLYSEKADTKEQVEEIRSAIENVLPVTGGSPFHIVPSENGHSESNIFQKHGRTIVN